ncbi:unnamed protein product, partial [Mesorhabditis spiculigera]
MSARRKHRYVYGKCKGLVVLCQELISVVKAHQEKEESVKTKVTHHHSTPKKRKLQPFTELHGSGQRRRLQQLEFYIQQLAGPSSEDSAEAISDFLQRYLTSYRCDLLKNVLTPTNDLFICTKLGISQNKRAQLKAELRVHGLDVFAATHEVIKLRKELKISDLYAFSEVEAEITVKEKAGNSIKKLKIPAFTCIDVLAVITSRLTTLVHKGMRLFGENGDEVWLGFFGDKGGGSTKFGFMVGNVSAPNRPDNLSLLAMYYGDDNAIQLRAVLAEIARQINELSKIELEVAGVKKKIVLRKFLVGDMPFLCACYGHQGHSSAYPCLICEDKKVTIGQLAAYNTPKTLRTLDRMHQQANRADDKKSMVMSPLLEVEPDHITLSELHILLGIGNMIMDRLTHYAILADCEGSVPDSVLEQIKKKAGWSKQKKEYTEQDGVLAADLHQLQTLRKDATIVSVVVTAINSGKIQPVVSDGDEEPLCAYGNNCCFVDKRMNKFRVADPLDWASSCLQCGGDYHAVCVGLFEPAEIERSQGRFLCPRCTKQPFSRLVKSYEDYIALLDNAVNEKKEEKARNERILTDLKEYADEYKGANYQNLQKVLRQIGVDQSLYFGSLTGNQAKALIAGDNPKKVVSVLPQRAELVPLQEFMEVLGKIYKFATTRFHVEGEIDKFMELLSRFQELVVEIYSHENKGTDPTITPKLHWLLHHVPAFLLRLKRFTLFLPIGALIAIFLVAVVFMRDAVVGYEWGCRLVYLPAISRLLNLRATRIIFEFIMGPFFLLSPGVVLLNCESQLIFGKVFHAQLRNPRDDHIRIVTLCGMVASGIVQNIFLLALTFVGERENGNLHTIFFCIFIVSTYLYLLSQTVLLKSSDYARKSIGKAQQNLRWKRRLLAVLSILLPFVFTLFFAHFLHCVPYSYELFCLSEYATVATIFAFHVTTVDLLQFDVLLVHRNYRPHRVKM